MAASSSFEAEERKRNRDEAIEWELAFDTWWEDSEDARKKKKYRLEAAKISKSLCDAAVAAATKAAAAAVKETLMLRGQTVFEEWIQRRVDEDEVLTAHAASTSAIEEHSEVASIHLTSTSARSREKLCQSCKRCREAAPSGLPGAVILVKWLLIAKVSTARASHQHRR